MKNVDPDQFKHSIMVLPNCSVMAADRNLPAAIRLAASDLIDEEYSTVGAILTNMAAKDLATLLTGWINTVSQVTGEDDDDDDPNDTGSHRLEITTSDAAVFLIFTMMVSRAEDGELKADPYLGGLKAELMASFMDAVLLARRDDNVFLDVTKLSLDPSFLDQDFNQIITSQNFKSLVNVKKVKAMWTKLRNSDNLKMIKESSQPKLDLSPSNLSKSLFKGKRKKSLNQESIQYLSDRSKMLQGQANGEVDIDLTSPGPDQTSGTSLSDFEAQLRRDLGGE